MSSWSTDTWAIVALYGAMMVGGLCLALFGGVIQSRRIARREAQGIVEEPGYRSPLDMSHPRNQGLVLLVIGVLGLTRTIVYR